ncbi:MAG: class I SAM-dependent methyltransferase [Acidobacteriota bacterium]
MTWYQEWFGADYLDLYAHRNRDEAQHHVDFVRQHVPLPAPGEGAVLDLCCGAGRHTAALRAHDLRVVGVDLSLPLLAHPPRVPSVGGDMRRLPFADDAFDAVLNFFTSFGYFERERENFQVLEEIVRVLRPGGRFLIDFLNKPHVLAHLVARETQTVRGRTVDIERWYDDDARRINKRMRIRAIDGGPARVYRESVRAYDRDEVIIGLRWAGLEVDALYGTFDGDPHDRDSPRLILVGHRAS